METVKDPNVESTSKLTNTINTLGYQAANNQEPVTRNSILSAYTKESLDLVWRVFSSYVIKNFQSGKGTFIKGLGTFTFSNIDFNLEGTTNQYLRDKKCRDPVFIVADDFCEGIKPGKYTKNGDLVNYTQKPNNSISIVNINFTEISLAINIPKDEVKNMFTNLIKDMSDQIKNKKFSNRELPGLGLFLLKNNLFGMQFKKEFQNSVREIPQKLIFTKKNIGLYMNVEKTYGKSFDDLKNAEKALNEIRPSTSAITYITPSGEQWLQNKLDINLKKDVLKNDQNELNKSGNLSNKLENTDPKSKFVSSKFFTIKNTKVFDSVQEVKTLEELNLSKILLESFIACKGQIIKEMKVYDRRNNGIISRFEFIRSLVNANIHYTLSMPIINEIASIYLENLDYIDYLKVITCLLKDIKLLLQKRNNESDGEGSKASKDGSSFNEKFRLGPKRYLTKNASCADMKSGMKLDSSYKLGASPSEAGLAFCRDYGKIDPHVDEVENEIKTIKMIFKEIMLNAKSGSTTANNHLPNFDKSINYNELNNILHFYSITYTMEKLFKILKFLCVKDPNKMTINSFNKLLKDCKLSTYEMSSSEINSTYEKLINLIKKNGGEKFIFGADQSKTEINLEEFIQKLKPLTNHTTNILTYLFEKLTNKNPTLTLPTLLSAIDDKNKTELNKKFFDDSATRIKNYIKSQKISNNAYFNHLLKYNVLRTANTLNRDHFVNAFQLEPYNPPFTKEQLNYIFDCLDTNKMGFIDRQHFKDGISKEQDALEKMQDIIKKLEFEISDLESAMELKKDQILGFYEFKAKMKTLDMSYTNEFIESLYIELVGNLNEQLPTTTLLKNFDVFKKDSFIETNTITFINNFILNIQKSVDFHTLKKAFEEVDIKFTGKIPKLVFCQVIDKFTREFKDEDIMKFVRIKKLNDFYTNEVLYSDFLKLIYYNEKLDVFLLCIDELKKLLDSKCGKNIHSLISYINLKKGVTSEWISVDNLLDFFKDILPKENKGQLTKSKISKFDLDSDGRISYEDLRGILNRYESTSFFKYENCEDGFNVNLYADDKLTEPQFKEIIREMKKNMKKNNCNEVGLFKKLDEDNDGFISNYEFNKNITSVLELSPALKDKIFNYLDYYHNGLIDLETFLLRFKEFKSNEVIMNNDNSDENIIIDEFANWIDKIKGQMCDTEIFEIIDNDSDGLISLDDFKNFVLNTLSVSSDLINNFKLERVMQSISLTKNKNIGLGDIREFMNRVLAKKANTYYVDLKEIMKETTNQNLHKNKRNVDWINQAIEKFGMFISEKFESIDHFFSKYADAKTGKFKFVNFEEFNAKNYECFYGFNLTKDELIYIFAALDSQKKNYLTIEDFKNKLSLFDFYKKMHFDIKTFLKENFPTNIDAFKFFLTSNIQKVTNSSFIPPQNYLTRKEFFNGLNILFPKKYTTNTILEYFNRYFKNKPSLNSMEYRSSLRSSLSSRDDLSNSPQVTYSMFSYIYFDKVVSNEQGSMSNIFSNHLSKISTSRSFQFSRGRNKSMSYFKGLQPLNKKLETPFDVDPLDKLRRIIRSSNNNYLQILKNKIYQSGNGLVNQFELRNIIRDFNLGLTSLEIENIIKTTGKTRDGLINLTEFYKFVSAEDKNLAKAEQNIKSTLSEIKSLLYKYYSNPKLAFEYCDDKKLNTMDFDQFKIIVNEIYLRDNKFMPNFSLLKNTYDYIDQRKDGIVDMNEWTNTFGENPGKNDVAGVNKVTNSLRKWEISEGVIGIYKLIAKNKKYLWDKVKSFCLSKRNSYLIHESNFIDILKDAFPAIKLSNTQWKMIVEIADKSGNGLIDFELFIKLVEHCAKKDSSHPKLV